jgi:hypothetical protein
VFPSSTSKDLDAHGEAARHAIDGLEGFTPIAVENFGARDTNASGIDREKIAEAHVLVGLMGHCCSSPPEEPTSYTEPEYDLASARDLPRLICVAADDFPLLQIHRESDDLFERQQAFTRRVMVDRVVASFAGPEELAVSVTVALANWRSRLENVEEIVARLSHFEKRADELELAEG